MGNIFTSALSGMNAAQYGMTTAEHNISNASTPGFTRQQVLTATAPSHNFGAGFIGQGVNVTGVKRIYDQYLTTQVLQQQTQASYLSSYHTAIAQIDNMFSDPAAGIAPAIRDLFSAINAVANNPASIPARQTFLSNARSLADRFQGMDDQLTNMANGLTGQIAGSVRSINSYAQQIATLNGAIKAAIGAGQGQQPNDLLDQRDQIINQLNQEIKATVLQQSDGSVNVFIGSGQPLVLNEQAMTLKTVQSASDPSSVDVAFQSGNVVIPVQQNSLQGGNLGAYLAFRDQTLEPARNALGRLAMGLTTSINQQNQMGQDLNGVLGDDLFKVAVPRTIQGAGNAGTASISAAISDISALTASDYQLRFDGANYFVTRLSDSAVTNLGATLPQTVDGFTVSLTSGSVAAGDTFLIRPTADGARDIALLTNDPTKVAAAVPIRTSASLSNLGAAAISSGAVANGTAASSGYITFSASTFNFSAATALVPGTSTPATIDTSAVSNLDFSIAANPATSATYTTSGNFTAADFTLSGPAAHFDLTDATGTFTIDLDGTDWTGNDAGMVAAINNQLFLAGSLTTVSGGNGSPLVFTSGDTGLAAVAPLLANIGVDLAAAGLDSIGTTVPGADPITSTNAMLTIDGTSITLDQDAAGSAATLAAQLTIKMQASALGASYSASASGNNITITRAGNTNAVAITFADTNAAAAGFSITPGQAGLAATPGNVATLSIGGTPITLNQNYGSFANLASAISAQLGGSYTVTNNAGSITVARTTTGASSSSVDITISSVNAVTAGLGNATGIAGADLVLPSSNPPLPLNANLQSPVSLTFTSPTTFTVAGAVPPVIGNVTFTSGQDISYNGWTVKITGTPVAGDVFNIMTNANSVGDNRNALLMVGLQTSNIMANGTASFEGIYSQLVGDVGATTHEFDVTSQAQKNMVAQAVFSQQSVSGVNLDEEAANLLQHQRAYQASAKAMQIANTMFDALLAIIS